MSILIIQGTQAAAQIPHNELARFDQLARAAGCALEWCRCSTLRDLIAQLHDAKRRRPEFLLLDPGDLALQLKAGEDCGLYESLDELDAPYVEVHATADAELDRRTGSHHAPVATVIIHGDVVSRYRIGLGIALRQLAAA